MSQNFNSTGASYPPTASDAASDFTQQSQFLPQGQNKLQSSLGAPAAPPSHHLHRESDALPGARDNAFSSDTRDPAFSSGARGDSDFGSQRFAGPGAGMGAGAQMDNARMRDDDDDLPTGRSAFTEERPLGVQPTDQGGVAIGGRSDLPEGRAGMMDKIVGKTQKVTGKMTANPEMHERGELRESGGKAAARGEARAPHD